MSATAAMTELSIIVGFTRDSHDLSGAERETKLTRYQHTRIQPQRTRLTATTAGGTAIEGGWLVAHSSGKAGESPLTRRWEERRRRGTGGKRLLLFLAVLLWFAAAGTKRERERNAIDRSI